MTRLITDGNWQDVRQEYGVLPRFIAYGSDEALQRGMKPLGDYPDMLIPEDEWKERIAEANEKKTMPMHHFEAAGAPAKQQGSTNYCWAYGMTSTVEAMRLAEGQPWRRLAPATLGWLVNFRNAGYYLSETIRGASERGIASSDFAGDGTTNERSFKSGWKEDALRHKPSEWFDTDRSSEKLMVRHCVSLLLTGLPLYIAYNWWSHALMMAAVEWDESQRNNLKWIAWNSHGDGRIELTGSRGVPDEAYGTRSTVFSP